MKRRVDAAPADTLGSDGYAALFTGPRHMRLSGLLDAGTRVFVLAIAWLLVLGLAERLFAESGFHFRFFYLLPVAVCAIGGDRRRAILCASAASVMLLANDLTLRSTAAGITEAWNAFAQVATLHAVALLIGSLRTSSQRIRSQSEEVFRLAITDDLTGLYNRRYLTEALVRSHANAQRTGRPYALLALDLDGFKRINDTLGHSEGDAALLAFAQELKRTIRVADIAVRMGGDEFLVLLADAGVRDAVALAERLQLVLRGHTRPQRSGLSAGAVAWRPSSRIEDLLGEADRLAYQSKRAGGGRVSVTANA